MSKLVLHELTHPQKRVWYIEKIYPSSSMYNIGGGIKINGNVDFDILEKSINEFIKNNDGVRIQIVETDDGVKQHIIKYKCCKLDYFDFSMYNDPQKRYDEWVASEAKRPFELLNNSLFYFAMFKISENQNGYLVKFHHIIADGWSINIMTQQICDVYTKMLNKEQSECHHNFSYIDYVDIEKNYLSSKRFLKDKNYWMNKYEQLPEFTMNTSSDYIEGNRETYEIDEEISLKIKELVSCHKCSLNTFFVAVYIIYLYKTTNQKDIVIGTPVLNRSGKKEKNMFGMFTSTMPFRFTICEEDTILQTIIKINEALMECYFNQKYPYNLLVQDLELKKRGYDNLFNVCVNYYNTKLNTQLNNMPIENKEFYSGNQIYSMQLVIKDWSEAGSLIMDIDYKNNDYTLEQIKSMFESFVIIIDKILINENRKIQEFDIVSDNEKNELINKFNDTDSDYPKNQTIYQLFEQQVERNPEKIAISFDDEHLTYKVLNEKSNQLARILKNNGIKNDSITAILTKHSIETVIAILAVLKAGGAYLPIDAEYPQDRISYMLEDSKAQIILTNIDIDSSIEFNGDIINLNNEGLYFGECSNLEQASKPKDLAYVIYTSGSTGKPKGTMIEHMGLVNYICWAKQMYVKDTSEVFALYSSLAFDLTVTSIFTPLISGSRIIVYRDDQDEYVLYRIMKENRVTVLKLTPSHLSLIKDKDNKTSSINRFIVGGEDLKVDLARKIHKSFIGNIEIYNEYGPTEAVVGCMIHKYDVEKDTGASVPIGIPAHNVQIYILDENLNPVPVGATGEMYISGDGVARGYLNRTDLTNEKFVKNPFIENKRMYKTGDLARFLNDYKIEYVGRCDHQVKIRGYRIELGEIERCLLNHNSVEASVVVDIEDRIGGKYLCAHIIKKSEVTSSELKDHLLNHLPEYMVPQHIIEIKEIPLTANGKLDRALLPLPQVNDNNDSASKENLVFSNEKEKILAQTICKILNIDSISSIENFYHLGGDSIKAIQIASELNSKGLKLKVKDILSRPVIKEMALTIEEKSENLISQLPCEGYIKHSPIVEWFFSQGFEEQNYYNQSIVLEFGTSISVESLELVIHELIKQHDSLRINYDISTKELFYNNKYLNEPFIIKEYDISQQTEEEKKESIVQISEKLKSSLDIRNSLLINACLIKNSNQEKLLILTAHHLVVDGVSWRIIIEDIYTMLKQIRQNQKINLPNKTHSFKKWCSTIHEYKDRFNSQNEYWSAIENNSFAFPVDNEEDNQKASSINKLKVCIEKQETKALITNANTVYNTHPKDLLVIALAKTIQKYTGENSILIELEGHGREDLFENIDVTRTVGWFTSIFPVEICIEGNDLSNQIKSIKEQIRKIPENGLGYGVLKYVSKKLESNNVKKYIRFNYLGEYSEYQNNEIFKLSNKNSGRESHLSNHMTTIIDINAIIISGQMNIEFDYDSSILNENTIKNISESFINNLRSIIDYCINKTEMEFTPTDFETLDISQNELDSLFN